MPSCTMLINQTHPLPRDYMPANLTETCIPFDAPLADSKRLLVCEAANAVQSLFLRAKSCGIALYGVSGYRSFARQEELYQIALQQSFRGTALSVAAPGQSEHQSGLALDVSCPQISLSLDEEFGNLAEGKWISSYAPLYGFILRYPKEKEEITGFPYEPWHIRYVGKSLALYLSLTGLTLDEYHEL